MVFDKLENYNLYSGLSPRIAKALKMAAETDFSKIEDGDYPVDGKDLYYLVRRYKTGPLKDKLETHRKYIDIQILIKGSERIGYDHREGLKQVDQYNTEKDVEFFKAEKSMSFIDTTEKTFVIFFPADAHMPGRQIDKPQDVLKVVFKVKL